MKRKIIHIDEEKCTGCGLCIPNCPEGAIQLIDNRARIVSDLFCDGLGACIGHCPEGAITIEEREALPYDERKVMERIVEQGQSVIRTHLEHLREHNEQGYLREAQGYLEEQKIEVFSELTHWPVQLHLVPAMAPHFEGQDILLCADCVAYACGNFHRQFLKGKMLAIACPKLDSHQEIYRDKLTAMIDHAKINTLTVVTMEVPCCRGLLMVAQEAARAASRAVPLKWVVVSIKGEVLQEEWVQVDGKVRDKRPSVY